MRHGSETSTLIAVLSIVLVSSQAPVVHVQPALPTDLVQITDAPSPGNYLSMQMSAWPPLPTAPFPGLAIYASPEDPGWLWYDDRATDYSVRFGAYEAPLPPGGFTNGGGGSNYLPGFELTDGAADGFSVVISNTATSALVWLTNTQAGSWYGILTNPSLGASNWALWQRVFATNSGTSILTNGLNSTALFFKGECLTSPGHITNGLVAYWRLNDGSGTNAIDSSGNGVNMPLFGNPSWVSNYLIFNGNERYGDAGSNELTSLDTSDKTICAWMNLTGLNYFNSSYQGILSKNVYYASNYFGRFPVVMSARIYSSVA